MKLLFRRREEGMSLEELLTRTEAPSKLILQDDAELAKPMRVVGEDAHKNPRIRLNREFLHLNYRKIRFDLIAAYMLINIGVPAAGLVLVSAIVPTPPEGKLLLMGASALYAILSCSLRFDKPHRQ